MTAAYTASVEKKDEKEIKNKQTNKQQDQLY